VRKFIIMFVKPRNSKFDVRLQAEKLRPRRNIT